MTAQRFSLGLGRLFGRWGRIPKSFGRYKVIRLINSGGMAHVYLAYDPDLNREVAVKVPRVDGQSKDNLDRFPNEAKAVAALKSTYIVPVTDYGKDPKRPYLVMPYMPNGSLADRLDRVTYTPQQALPIVDRIAAGLDHAHAKDVIHRDVKPGNILFDEDDLAFLSDFGIARYAGGAGDETRRHHSMDGKVRGTSAYMSPEQAIGRPATEQSDIYSLGIVLRHMLTGDPRESLAREESPGITLVNPPQPMPEEVRAIIDRATQMDPKSRYRKAQDLVDDLEKFVESQGPVGDQDAPPAPTFSRTQMVPPEPVNVEGPAPFGPRKVWLLGPAILFLSLGIWTAVVLWPNDPPPPPATTQPIRSDEVAEIDPIVTPMSLLITPSPIVLAATVEESAPPEPKITTERPTVTSTLTPMTPTASPSPTTTQSPTLSAPTPAVGTAAVVALTNIFTRAGPGLDYPVDGSLLRGQVAPLIAMDPSGFWYLVELASGRPAWVSRQFVTGADGAHPSDVPIAATIPPTSTPTVTPTAIPSATATANVGRPPPPPPPPPPITPTVTPGCLNPPYCDP